MAKTGTVVIVVTALAAALAGPAEAQRATRRPKGKAPAPAPVPAKAEPEPSSSTRKAIAEVEPDAITITVADAVRSALEFHPDVLKLELDVGIADAEVSRQRGLFQPILTASALQRREVIYNTSTPSGASSARSTIIASEVTGRTPIGGTYALNVSGQRIDGIAFNLLSALLPQYQTRVSGRYTQPLLRDAGTTANVGLIDRAKLGEESARMQRNERRQQLALEVVASYWTLVLRREDVQIRAANLSEAENLRELVERKIRGGQAPRSDMVQADVTVAERQQAVRQARLAVVDAERDLLAKTFLNRTGRFGWANALVPADRPGVLPKTVEFEEELAIALKHRPEVRRVERELALARLDYAIARNAQKIRVDVYAEAGLLGAAGRLAPGGTSIPAILDGGVGRAVGNTFGVEAPFFELGVLLEIPLGNSDRAGAATQAKLRIDQVLAEDVRTGVALDVRAALQALDLARSRLQGAIAAEKLATENLEVQRKRYEGGASTIFDTLRVQDELARAKAEIVLASAEQEVALSQLMAARGTLLEQLGIEAPPAR